MRHIPEKTTPFLAILSIFGVKISLLPWNPTSAYPWSSLIITITFGGLLFDVPHEKRFKRIAIYKNLVII